MKVIIINSPTYGIHEVFVDDEDFDRVSQFTWSLNKHHKTFYASRTVVKSRKNPKLYHVYLHRFILQESNPEIYIDHKNHNGLDVQKHNLRRCTHAENKRNAISLPNSTSKYLGVSLSIVNNGYKIYKYWLAAVGVKGNRFQFRSPYTSEGEIQAAKWYDKKAKEIYGAFANLNFKD